MPVNPYLSTQQVSDALGVSVSTVKRWVDEGIIPAHRTAGGHRKLLRADVLRVARNGELASVDLSQLEPVAVAPKTGDVSDAASRLFAALAAGDYEAVRAVILGAYRARFPMGVIADQIVAVAMCRIGHEWSSGAIDVMHEHRATQLCVDALHELKRLLRERVERRTFLAIGAAPEHDFYTLSGLLVELTLIDAGWRCVNLGSNAPMASLRRAAEEMKPRLLWLSVSHVPEPSKFLEEYASLYHAAESANVAVAIGGQALTEKLRSRMRYTMFGDGMTQFEAFIKMLLPPKAPRRRGRPRNAQ